MIVRPEQPADVPAIRAVTSAAFLSAPHAAPPVDGSGDPGEAALVGWLRDDAGWIPELSQVVDLDGTVVAHGVCSRGYVDDAPALGLGPISVLPEHQGTGLGSALVESLLRVARKRGETVVALLGDPGYYGRFGFRPATELGIEAPDRAWGGFFQALVLSPGPAPTGTFRYAASFDRLAGA